MHCNHPAELATMAYQAFDAGIFADCALAQGARYIVFVAKHVDGFCWWQTATTPYSIKSARWKNGQGDVFGEVVKACRARGLQVGFYLCPRDDHFGARDRGLVDDPARQSAYNGYYCAQLTELCTRYGPMVEIWFDGALTPSLRERVRETILMHQPQACTFQGPVNTIRWVGNEGGAPPRPAWNVISLRAWQTMVTRSEYPTCVDGDPDGVFWAPNEVDTTLSTDWFGSQLRPLPDLVRCYYNAVGNSAQLLMNVSPRADGSIAPDNLKRAAELGAAIKAAVGYPLATTNGQGATLTLDLEGPVEIDHVIIQEDIAQGERVRQYVIEGLAEGQWRSVAEGIAIGHKKIHKLPPTRLSQVRLTVAKFSDTPRIRRFYVTRTGLTMRDKTPPTVPARLEGNVVSDQQVDLTWSSAADPETGVAVYQVWRNGVPIGEARLPSYSDRDLAGSATYGYAVLAINGAGLAGGRSQEISVTTPKDTTPPAVAAVQQDELTHLKVTFTERVELASATNAANYKLSDGAVVTGATLTDDQKSVILTVSPLHELATYTLMAENVRDRAAVPNLLAAGTRVSFRCLNGLSRWFKLDERQGTSAADRLGGAPGAIRGAVAWETEPAALVFDGTSTAIDIGPSTIVQGPFTVAALIKPAGSGPRMILAQDRSGHGDYQFRLQLGTDNRLFFYMTDDAGQDFGLDALTAPVAVTNEVWTHVAVTRDADTFRLFLNGREVARRTTTGHIMQPYNPVSMLLGARFQSDEVTPGDFFQGRMSDVRLYSRPLSGAELAIIASASRPVLSGKLLIGADVSWVPQQEAEGRRFSVDGVEQDVLSILKDHRFNAIRLRLFVDPSVPGGYSAKGYCGLESTLAMAGRVKTAGLRFLLDFHYSDTWADPGHQKKPAEWRDLDFTALTNAVYRYTRDTLATFARRSLTPDVVQVGNEISAGLLWPEGKGDDFDKLAALLRAGIRGVREAAPSAQVMLHLALGGQNEKSRWFLDNALRRGVDFDLIGQSYYARWHGTLEDLQANLADLASRYRQGIVVVEYSAPDGPAIHDILRSLPAGKGRGSFIWEPTHPGHGNLFDPNGGALPALRKYRDLGESDRIRPTWQESEP